jgi:hypothetical protein
MAALIVASIAALVVGGEKLVQRRKKKRASKAQNSLLHGPVEEVAIIDDATEHQQIDELPGYHREELPAYRALDEHPAVRTNNQNAGSPQS